MMVQEADIKKEEHIRIGCTNQWEKKGKKRRGCNSVTVLGLWGHAQAGNIVIVN